jgi:hypothetical protein
MQIPAMVEWSILNLDKHGLPAGEGYRGYRTAIAQLIKKGVLTEKKAHEIFGKSTEGTVSRRYRRSLHAIRNSVKRESAQDEFNKFS